MELFEVVQSIRRLELMRKISIRRQLAAQELHPGQPQILDYILRHGGCNQKDIAAELDISPASAAASIKRLQKKGYVRRVADKSDNRKNIVNLTIEGKALLERGKEVFDQLDQKMFQGISEAELKLYKELCDKMFDNMADESMKDLNMCRLTREAAGIDCETQESEE